MTGNDSASTHALSDVLDTLEASLGDDRVTVGDVVDNLGQASFASIMLVFSLVAASPASAIPGLTALVAMIVLTLVVQMMLGRESLWLPDLVTRKGMDSAKVKKGIAWVRKPVAWVEKLLKPRLTFLLRTPWLWLPMVLIAGLTLFMPFMELVPTSGSIASAVIALFAASLLTRDGVLTCPSLALLLVVPLTLYFI